MITRFPLTAGIQTAPFSKETLTSFAPIPNENSSFYHNADQPFGPQKNIEQIVARLSTAEVLIVQGFRIAPPDNNLFGSLMQLPRLHALSTHGNNFSFVFDDCIGDAQDFLGGGHATGETETASGAIIQTTDFLADQTLELNERNPGKTKDLFQLIARLTEWIPNLEKRCGQQCCLASQLASFNVLPESRKLFGMATASARKMGRQESPHFLITTAIDMIRAGFVHEGYGLYEELLDSRLFDKASLGMVQAGIYLFSDVSQLDPAEKEFSRSDFLEGVFALLFPSPTRPTKPTSSMHPFWPS
jgi:hypothetical protein